MLFIEKASYPSIEQMAFVIEAMRNPMNSWDKSDTQYAEMDDINWESRNGIDLGESDEK